MYPWSVHAIQADALFASAAQRSDEPSISQIRRAITAALNTYGGAGCAGRVAQEFGDHPDTAAARMRWAHAAVAVLDGPVLGDQYRLVS
jgi:hypothetical protein